MLTSLISSICLVAILVTGSFMPDIASAFPFGKNEKKNISSQAKPTELDQVNLRKNALERLIRTIKEQQPAATGLEALTIDNMVIGKIEPIGVMDLFLVKMAFTNPAPENQENFGDIEMVMLVDQTGTYQFQDVFKISDGKSQSMDAKRNIFTTEHDPELGDLIVRGTGKHQVVFFSDNFCPFCQRAYTFLMENLSKIDELRIVHLPMPALHPTATIASLMMAYAKDALEEELFTKLVTFAYTELQPGEQVLEGQTSGDNRPINSVELKEMELNVVNQFVTRFPELSKDQDIPTLYENVKKTYASGLQKEAREVMQRFKISGTPATMVNGYLIRGFNRLELQGALDSNQASTGK